MSSAAQLVIRISGDSKRFRSELNRLERESKSTTDSLNRDAKRLSENRIRLAKRTALVVGTLAAVGVGGAIKDFADFETALVATGRTTGLTGQELKKFGGQITEVSKQLGRPAVELLKISEIAGTLGIEGSKNLSKFTKTMAQFDIASATLRGAEAASQIARIIQLTGGDISNVERYASEIAFLGDNFNTTEAGIAEVARELSSVNALFKLSTLDTLDLAAALSEGGITGEIARTSITKFSDSFRTALVEGGRNLEIFKDLTGLTGDELEKTFFDDPAVFFQKFIGGLKKTGRDSTTVLKELGLNQARLQKVFLISAERSDRLAKALDRKNNEEERANKLSDETKKALDTTAARAKIVKEEYAAISREVGEALIPAVEDSLVLLKELAPFLTDVLVPAISKTVGFISKLVGGLQDTLQAVREILNIATGIGVIAVKATGAFIGDQGSVDFFKKTNQQKLDSQKELYDEENRLLTEAGEANKTELERQYDEQQRLLDEHLIIKAAVESGREQEKKDKAALDRQEKLDLEGGQREEDLELEDERFEEDLERLEERLGRKNEVESMFSGLKELRELQEIKSRAKTAANVEKINKLIAKSGKKYIDIQARDALEGLEGIFDNTTKFGKAVFLFNKALAISDTIITTQDAAMRAYGSQLIVGDPSSLARAEAARLVTIIKGAVSVATIGASAIKGVQGAVDGTIVGNGVLGKDTEPFLLAKNEIVLPSKANPLSSDFDETFGQGGLGGSQNVNITIDLTEDASQFVTVQQREDSTLGVQT